MRYLLFSTLFKQTCFVKPPDYLVWLPRRSFRQFHGMGGYQPETPYRFSLPSLRRADACLWHVPNPPKDGAYAAKCQARCPLQGTPLPVSLLSGNGYGTQSVRMSWNEKHQTGLCVDSIAARPGPYDCRRAEDNGHPLGHHSTDSRNSHGRNPGSLCYHAEKTAIQAAVSRRRRIRHPQRPYLCYDRNGLGEWLCPLGRKGPFHCGFPEVLRGSAIRTAV